MASRRLGADEAALWARVMAGVRPLVAQREGVAKKALTPSMSSPVKAPALVIPAPVPASRLRSKEAVGAVKPAVAALRPGPPPQNTLDGTWDRRLSRGLVAPDRTVDLHGYTLASAHALLDAALADAVRDGARLLLLVTGKPPRPASQRPHAPDAFRGAIRAAVGDWLAGSRFSHDIAAVRAAHPRHGGAGALYIVIRKPRAARKS